MHCDLLILELERDVVIIERCEQGPPGPAGAPGASQLRDLTDFQGPLTDGEFVKYDAASDKFVLDAVAGGGGGSYTDEEAQDAVGTILTDSDSIDFAYDDSLNTITAIIAATYPGQASIVTLGTVTTGTWHGTPIADAYISSAATWNAKASPSYVDAAIAAHEAAADPHPAYELEANLTEDVQDIAGGMVSGNTEDGLTVAYDDPTGKLNFTNTDKGSTAVAAHEAASDPHPQYLTAAEGATQYTDEMAQDAVGTILTDSATIDFTYDDATPSITAVVIDGSVSLAKMADLSTQRFIGRTTAGTGVPESLTVAQAKTLLNLTGTNSGDQTITLTGDVTGSGTGSFSATIATAAVTLAKMANIATQTFIGRTTAATGVPEALTVAQAKTMLNLTGTNSGDQTITLTGDVTGSGTGSFAATIANNAVTYAKMQDISAASLLLGRGSAAGSGDPQEITLGTGLTMSGTTLNAAVVGGYTDENAQDAVGTILTDSATIDFTYDDTANTISAIVIDASITLAKMANIATQTFIGRTTAATGVPEALTIAQAKTMLNLTGTNSGDQTITLTGDVTGSGTGSFAATIANDAVTYAKMQNISATDRLLGRDTAAAGDTEELTVGGGIEFTGSGGIQTSAFTGDVTKSAGGTALTIAADAVTYAKMQNMSAASVLLGRGSAAGAGDPQEITLGTGVAMTGTVLSATGSYSDEQAQDAIGTILTDSATIDFTYDDTANTITAIVIDASITLAKMANVATQTFIGRTTAGTGVPEALTVAQAKTMLSLTGTNSGDQTITLTGDVTGSGTGSFAATVANDAVTNAKSANMAVNTIKGRITTGTGDPEDLTATQVRTIINVADGANNYVHPNHTGDVTSVGDGAQTIAANAVTFAKMQDLSANVLIGAVTAGDPVEISLTSAGRALIDDADAAAQRTTLGLGTIATQNANAVAITGGSITALETLSLDDTDASHSLALAAGSNLTANRTLTVTTGDASRILTLTGDTSLSGTNTGDQTITLTGDVTGSGTGSFAATIATAAVTLAKMADIATQTFIGRTTAATGVPEALTVAQAKTMLNLTGTNSGDQTITLTGDVTGSGTGSFAATIAANAVSNTKLRDSVALSVIGRSAASTGDPADISASAASDAVLRESGSVLGFGTIATGGIANDAVTYAKIQNVTTNRLLGRATAGSGDTEEITLGTNLSFTGTTLNAASGSSLPVADTTNIVQGSADATKLLRFEVDGFTTGTTRVITPPNADTTLPIATQVITWTGPTAARTYTLPDAAATLARTDAAQTFTGVQTFSSAPDFSTMTAGSVLFAGASGALTQDNDNFFWDSANTRLGIGTTAPQYKFHMVSDGNIFAGVQLDTYSSNSVNPFLAGRRARNTSASPQAVQLNDTLMQIDGVGHDGSTFTGQGFTIISRAEETWSSSTHGTSLQFRTAAIGDTTAKERLRIGSTGNLGIGTSSPDALLELSNDNFASVQPVFLITNDTNTNTLDPVIQFALGSTVVTKFTLGVDDSDADKFKISAGSALGTTDRLVISSTGTVTIPDFTSAGPVVTSSAGLLSVGSATIYQTFEPAAGVPPASNYATYNVRSGTNFPVPSLDFDPTTDESIFFFFRAVRYGSGNITVEIDWYADTATSANVVWEASIAAITPDTDTQDIETKAFATINFVQDTHLGTTGQRLHRAVLTISNLDSIAANDWCVLKISRDANSTNATDDLTGDCSLVLVTLSYASL